jgi:hypothetical protein
VVLYERIKAASIVTSDSKNQATKAKKASDMLARIATILSVDEPPKQKSKPKVKKEGHFIASLFDGIE